MQDVKRLAEETAEYENTLNRIAAAVKAEGRSMTDDEFTTVDELSPKIAENKRQIETLERIERISGAKTRSNDGPAYMERTAKRISHDDYQNAMRYWLATGDQETYGEEVRKYQRSAELCGVRPNAEFVLPSVPYQRAQSTTTGSEGGYTVPEFWASEIDVALKAYGGIRSVANVVKSAGGNSYFHPLLDDTARKAVKINQNGQVSSTSIAFGQKEIKAQKYTTNYIPIPEELVRDSSTDILGYVTDAMVEGIWRGTEEDYLTGAGTGTIPQGALTASTLGHTSTSEDTISIEDLMRLEHSVDRAYRNRDKCVWVFNDATLLALKMMTVGTNDARPLFLPDVRSGEGERLLGYRYVICNDMPDVEADAKCVLFGDMSKYRIRDVGGVRFRRFDDFAFGQYDQVGLCGFFTTYGCKLSAGDPFKHLKMAPAA